MRTKAEIQADLATATDRLGAAERMNAPASLIEKAKSKVETYKNELAEFKEEVKEEKKEEKKEEPKKASKPDMPKKVVKKKPSAPKKTAPKKVEKLKKVAAPKKAAPKKAPKPKKEKAKKEKKSVKSIEYKGKTYTEKDIEFCDILQKKWDEKSAGMKKAKKKFNNKSVSTRVGADIAAGAVKAIKHTFQKHSAEITKHPETFIKKMERVNSAGKKYAAEIKNLLGKTDSASITAQLKKIEQAIKQIEIEIKAKIKANLKKKVKK